MKKILFILACLPWVSADAQPYWQQEVNYSMDVSLNDSDNSLKGFINMEYINHSPDTLHFIWFRLWPNAFKTDRTAFSDQLLENGRTDFYFSDQDQRGYINRLDFRVDGRIAPVEDHPEFIDLIKVILPGPLAPGQLVRISTPFYEKIPIDFSGGGHLDQCYRLMQWYPKPAVYDQSGWHPIPYLDQGGSYDEYGNYAVRITLPANYVVAASGELQNEEEKKWLSEKAGQPGPSTSPVQTGRPVSGQKKQEAGPKTGQNSKNKGRAGGRPAPTSSIPSSPVTKTIEFKEDHLQDFCWYADKHFLLSQDSLKLPSGRTLAVYHYYRPENKKKWSDGIPAIKKAIGFFSSSIGEYPYPSISIVEDTSSQEKRGLPLFCFAAPGSDERKSNQWVVGELGRAWFCEAIGSNQRDHPWLSKGISCYYQYRFQRAAKFITAPGNRNQPSKPKGLANKWPDDPARLWLETAIKEKSDQPISTPSAEYSPINYLLIPQTKTAFWLAALEDSLGTSLFDSCMQAYFHSWQFKHPGPADFRSVFEKTSGIQLGNDFAKLDKKGPITDTTTRRVIKPVFLFSFHQTEKIDYINIGPAIGYNQYDQLMVGVILHNFNLPPDHFQFLLAPLYAIGSRQFNGLANLSYTWHPDRDFKEIRLGLAGSRFSTLSGTDTNGNKIFGGFYKVVPSLRIDLKGKTARSSLQKWIGFKTFLIGEKAFNYFLHPADSLFYPAPQPYAFRYLNQLDFNWQDDRVLYPYNAQVQLQQASEFYRLNLTGNYFFNYSDKGGLQVRFFAAKFGYIGEKTSEKTFETSIYQPKLTAVRGDEDYTYGNYFLGRNESTGFASQQIMIRDGGLKLRTDLFQGLQGRSDNWIVSANFNSSLPTQLIPAIIPLKVFLDVGTYADAWGSSPPTSKFLYVGGLQLSLLKGLFNIYAPIVYSSDFSDNLKTVPEENTFWKKISFSIDVQNFNFRKIERKIPLQ